MPEEGRESQYADVGETQKSKDYAALKKEEERIAKETGKDYSKVK
jgi:hypothetical protein